VIHPRRRARLYLELLLELARRETRRRYKDTILGWLWIILIPLLQSIVIAYFFVRLAGIDLSSSGAPYILLVLSGFTIWNYVSHTIGQAMSTLSDSRELVNTQPIPLTLLPLSGALVKTYDWLIEVAVFALFVVILTGDLPTAFLLGIGPLAVSLIMFVSGLALLTALVGSFVRDAGHLVSLLLSIWFWLTPIFYPAERIAAHFTLINLNPLIHFLSAFRQLGLEGVMDADKLAKLFVCSAAFLVTSLLIYRRTAWRIYDRP
jgi:ABC-type polysaccharide/polyol phosphate export permease